MADFGKFKKSSLGAPPTMEEVKGNLTQPELATSVEVEKKLPIQENPKAVEPKLEAVKKQPIKVSEPKLETPNKEEKGSSDGAKIIRTKPLATKVTPEFHKKLKTLAAQYEMDMVEIVEQGVELWINSRNV